MLRSNNPSSLDIVFIGLAITSSWGNGHATTYRSLAKGLHLQGHRVTFLERDQPWYADNRDAPSLPYCETHLYSSLEELRTRFGARVRNADAVIVGSYVQDGVSVCDWVLEQARGVRAFYDIDTPVTLSCLRTDTCEYLRAHQIAEFDLMLSFTGGPTLRRIESTFGARSALPLFCSVDVDAYRRVPVTRDFDLGYMGTYSADRQASLEGLLNEPARQLPNSRFIVVGAQYPGDLHWPSNVRRIDHLAPREHAQFYSRQRFTLNLTRADMRAAGHSPSVRLFEAAACETPIVSDVWDGIEEIFLPNEEILLAEAPNDVVRYLRELSDSERQQIARRARERVLAAHSSERRAAELVGYIEGVQRRAARVTMPESRSRIVQSGALG